MSEQPWSRNEGKFDRLSSVAPKAAEDVNTTVHQAAFDPAEAYRGIEPIDAEVMVTEGDLASIETEALAGEGAAISDSHWQLRVLVERIERLDDEIADIRADRKDVMAEAKATGFDLPALREVLRRRKLDPASRDQLDGLVGTYEAALGMSSRGTIDGGELTTVAALPAPSKALTKEQRALAEADAWADGLGR